MNNFEEIYNELKNKYDNKYRAEKEKLTTKNLIYIYFTWFFLETLKIPVRNFFTENSTLYLFIRMLSTLSMLFLIICIFVKFNKKVEYWKKATEFKDEVGTNFWNKINDAIKYNSNRDKIDNNFWNTELNYLYKNSTILDIEETLTYADIELATIKFNDEDKKRKNGIFTIINNCNKDIKKDDLKDLKFEFIDEIIKMSKEDNKLFLLFDAKEVFYFNGTYFLKKEELEENYKRFSEILRLSEYVKKGE